jgi:outer membrane protein assembly factor BamB
VIRDRFSITSACILLAVLVGWPTSLVAKNEWANWRGPNHDGSSDSANPPTVWDQERNIRWKVPVPGRGSGSPIVWDNQIILLTAIDTGRKEDGTSGQAVEPEDANERPQGRRGGRGGRRPPPNVHDFAVIAYDFDDGRELWRMVVTSVVPHEGGHPTNTFASSSAVTDGQSIYASFGSRGIYRLDMEGNLKWKRDFGKMRTRNEFGEGSSPALVNNVLIVPWDHEGPSQVHALDADTGEIIWTAEREEPTTWATPLAIESGGRHQVVTNGTIVRSYDVATGELLWSCGGQVSNPIPSPIRLDDFVVCMTGFRGNAIFALPLDARGDISDSDVIRWHNHEAAPYIASPTLYKGQLYFTKERTGVMSSLDARTGEVRIPPTRLTEIRDVYASPVAAGDKVYFTSRDGVTTVIRHGASFEELSINKLGEPVDASPAIVGNSMLIRGAEHLYRIAE